ncbi:MAG: hypothetical protein B7X06_02250 [Verrucomicrobia bacterium 21-51-4]|nr:MAG: hypothetical protein B7X06_02250 [Verrucomicrobia bacterium 21-51-4]HQU09170.1 hypothetical protein [Opitutales bacterium]
MDFSNFGDWIVPALLIVYYLFSAFKNRSKVNKEKGGQPADSVRSPAEEASRKIREEIARKVAQRQGKLASQPIRPTFTAERSIPTQSIAETPGAYAHDWDTVMKLPATTGPLLVENRLAAKTPLGVSPAASWLRSSSALKQAVINAEILGQPRGLREWDY